MKTGSEPVWTRDLLGSPHSAPDKAGRVRSMFNAIAPRYELINSLFSAGRDAAWRRRAVELARVGRSDHVLDVACGTGDFARAFMRAGPARVVACDFAHRMLTRALADSPPALRCFEGDALMLPFRHGSFSVVACAFGVRNFDDLDRGLYEMFRVLKRGGRVVILEFTRPANRIVRAMYELYSTRFMPLAASLVSGDKSGAYRYLPCSVVSFLDAERLAVRLQGVGFTRVAATPLTLGIVTAYVATRE